MTYRTLCLVFAVLAVLAFVVAVFSNGPLFIVSAFASLCLLVLARAAAELSKFTGER